MKFSGPRWLLHVEGLAVLVAACVLYHRTGASWGRFALWFLVPDLSMLGYLVGLRAGAWSYNVAHTYTVPFVVWIFAHATHHSYLISLSLIWAAHIGFDRLLGYGLKYETGFKDTHLGRV